jgi:hypothetical protein
MNHRHTRSTDLRTVRKLGRLSAPIPMEQLEARTMMSVTTLATPTALTAKAAGPTSVQLSWTESTKTGNGYTVLRSTDGVNYSALTHVTSAATTKFSDTTVQANKNYSYRVEATNSTLATSPSSAAAVTTPLIAPTGLTGHAVDGGHVTLSWTGNDSSAAGYNILRSANGGAYSQVASVNSESTTTVTDGSVVSGQSYKYEVEAYSGSNTSAVTAPVAVVTSLGAPSNFTASASSSSLVHLSWTGNDSHATGYAVLRSTDDVHFTSISKLTTASAVSFDDKTVLPFTQYYYEVEATSSVATSPASGQASATTQLATPTAVSITSISPTSVALKWTDTDAAAQGYYILRSSAGGSFTQVGQTSSGKTTSFTDSTASSDTAYSYEIKSHNGSTISAATAAVQATTPLATPTALSATTVSGTSVQLTWTDNDSTATGYILQRAMDGKAFANVATISSGSAVSFTDTVASGHMYNYSLIATNGNVLSAMSSLSTTVTPLVTPINLTAAFTSANSIQVSWSETDPATTGFKVMRSTDGTNFSLLSTITSASTKSLVDKTALSNHTYYYEVQAVNGSFSSSALSGSVNATTPMLAPTKLTAGIVGSAINLTWTNSDTSTTGVVVLRSTNGTSFTTLATLNTAATSYTDSSITAGQKYYYEIQGTNSSQTSPVSNIASVVAPAAPVSTNTVSITTRYSNELVITATGNDDTISISQSNGNIVINADGTTTTQPVPAAGVFLYTRGGSDGITIAQSDTTRTTVETVDTGVDDITSAGSNVSAWIDSTDVYTGTGTVHSIASFAGGIAKTTGTALADPKDAGKTMKVNASLWGTGPSRDDILQGGVGDCYFLSSLAAFAGTKPSVLMESAVDMGDGTYVVQFINSKNTPVFVRVSNDISTGAYYGYAYTRPGADGDVWAPIMEKAFAEFRTGANTYASISSGWMGEVYSDLGQSNYGFSLNGYSQSALYAMLSADLASGKAVTFGTQTAPNLVSGHAYTLVSASTNSAGVTSYVVRNPWGVSGDSLENSQGYATLTYTQMEANFVDGCEAT